MRGPMAICEDHQLSHFSLPLMFVRWTDYRCPHCNHVFRRDYFPGKITLGRGERTCPNCSRSFDDGSREWPELRFADKLGFLFPAPAKVAFGSVLLILIIAVCLGPRDRMTWVGVPIVVALVAVLTLPWLTVRVIPVRRSIRNYEIRVSKS
jgi:hypothetical protein